MDNQYGTDRQQVYQPQPSQPILQQPEVLQKTASGSFGTTFVQKYLGLLVLGILLMYTFCLMVYAAISSPNFLYWPNISNILRQYGFNCFLVIGTVVAVRIKGPDMSMGSVMALAGVITVLFANESSIIIGIVVAIIACFFFGLFNGALISLLNAPAIITTFITTMLLRQILLFITNGMPLSLNGFRGTSTPTGFLVLLFALLFVVLIIGLTALAINMRLPLLKPYKNKILSKVMVIIGYGFIAVIAGIFGFAMLRSFGAAGAFYGQGYDITILIIFAALQSSKFFKNSLISLGYGFLIVILLTISRNAMMFSDFPVYIIEIPNILIAILLLCTACIAQGGWKSMLSANLSECDD